MRLGQFARRFDLPLSEIIEFLEGKQEFENSSFHPNIKLEQAIEEEILDFFGKSVSMPEKTEKDSMEETPALGEESNPVISEQPHTEATEEAPTLSAAEEIAAVSGEIFTEGTPTEESTPSEAGSEKISEEHTIQTDQLLEMLDSESPVDLNSIKLIKAPKRELSGLKVVGKVELPIPEKKSQKEEASGKSDDNSKPKKRKQLSEAEKEKRRLKAKRKKEAYEARQEAIQKKKEAQQLKKRKEAHYKQRISQAPVNNHRKKVSVKKSSDGKSDSKHLEKKPKTLLGRFWKWMNT